MGPAHADDAVASRPGSARTAAAASGTSQKLSLLNVSIPESLPVAIPAIAVPSKKTTLELILPVLALLTAYLIFSLYNVIVKKALNDGTNPLVLAFIREVIATCILVPFAYFSERKKPVAERKFWPNREDWALFILLGMVMVWSVQVLSILALSQLTATTYSMLAPIVPPTTLAIALLFGYEPFKKTEALSWLKVAAVALAAGGALYIAVAAANNASSSSVSKNVYVGMLFLLTNKVSVASYPVIEKRLLKTYPPVMIVAWGYLFGCAATLVSVIPNATDPSVWKISSSGLGAIAYSSVLSSSVNYTLLIYANKRTSPLFVMTLYPLQSLLTPLLSYAILGTGFSSGDAIGGLIIVAALAICVFVRWKESKLREQRAQVAAADGGDAATVPDSSVGYAAMTGIKSDDVPASPFPIGNGIAGSADEMGIADEVAALQASSSSGGVRSRIPGSSSSTSLSTLGGLPPGGASVSMDPPASSSDYVYQHSPSPSHGGQRAPQVEPQEWR